MSIEYRALELLSSGVQQEHVASALGVSPSAISQLLADPEFARKVSEARFSALQKHNKRDGELDTLEDLLIEKVRESIPLISRPLEAVQALKVINAAHRRGKSAPESLTAQKEVVPLRLPTTIINNYTLNIETTSDNRVIRAGQQQLVTIQSSALKAMLPAPKALEVLNDGNNESRTKHPERVSIEHLEI